MARRSPSVGDSLKTDWPVGEVARDSPEPAGCDGRDGTGGTRGARHSKDAMYSKLGKMNSTLYLVPMGSPTSIRVHLRRHRLSCDGMTQQELADRVGVTRQTILSIERGKYRPSIGLALKLARVFSLPVESLFVLDDPEEGS